MVVSLNSRLESNKEEEEHLPTQDTHLEGKLFPTVRFHDVH